jgi:hypothetical protein
MKLGDLGSNPLAGQRVTHEHDAPAGIVANAGHAMAAMGDSPDRHLDVVADGKVRLRR